ncbi:Zinc finger protein [Pseudolycoriella hygida]|uniref:Zinc finger protein n=1 Tax=Pseudolycoriella hygida TaxID=35572 RepID=A0A9Q0RYW0_9DIPT|nr:Zinc finger protein [Pseudolycoriella hygida]
MNGVLTFQCHCRQQIDAQNKDRIVTEACGHSKCRNCFIKEEYGCVKCLSLKTSSNQHTITILPSIEKLDSVPDGFSDHHEYALGDDEPNRNTCTNLKDVLIPSKAAASKNPSNKLKNPKDIQVLEDVIIKPFLEIPSNGGADFTFPRIKGFQKLKYPPHISWEIVNGRTEFKCNICEKSFHSKSNRRYHFYCDKTIAKPFSCSKCPKTFAAKNHLKYHENRHNNIQHNCKECGRKFLSRVSLQKHLKVHTNDFKFICDHCDRKFYHKSDLILHMYTHKKLPLPFQCDSCDKAFSAKFKLNQHIEAHKDKAHSCQLCGKHFSRNSTLSIHMLTHSSLETKYECNLCFKSFDRQRSYDRHIKIKHGSTVFCCPLCDVQSGRKDNILRHIRNLHSDENSDEIIKKISKAATRLKGPESNEGSVNSDVKSIEKIKIIESSNAVCQYQSVIKFAGRSQPTPQPSQQSEDCSKDAHVSSNVNEDVSKTNDDKLSKNIQKKYCNELRVELDEHSGRDHKISNINIYRQLLSPYLRPPPNLETRNGIQEKCGEYSIQNDNLPIRKENVEIYRSILMSDHVQDHSMNDQNNKKLTNNKIDPLVIHGQNSEYFSEMHWRKRTSQCFNQME